MLSEHDISEAFRLTGIYPFNAGVIDHLKQTLKKKADQPDEENPNHLVDMGIVPPELVDILVPPIPRKKSTKRINGARLITAVNEPQPSTSGEDNNGTNYQPEIIPVIPEENHPDDGICVVCMTNQRLEWIGCDNCPNWLNYQCLNRDNQILVDLSIVTGDQWICGFCQEERTL
jgi:hypothetical protein